MAVVDEAWLAVWWPWLLVWVATVALLAAAVGIVVTHRRREARSAAHRHGISIYLDEDSVMDLYLQRGGRSKAALRHEVQERISSNRGFEASTDVTPLQAKASSGVNREVFRTYIEQAEPITVISTIIDALTQAEEIVDVDLSRQEVVAGAALDKAVRGRPLTAGVRLRQVEGVVSILGRFRVVDRNDDATAFEAPFGDPEDASGAAKVRVVCAGSGLRTAVLPSGQARCLGLVDDWDAPSRTLTVHPIAVFR